MTEPSSECPAVATLFAQSTDIVVMLDATLVWVVVNPSAAALFQRSVQTLTGQTLEALVAAEPLPAQRHALAQAMVMAAQRCLSDRAPLHQRHWVETAADQPLATGYYDFTYTPVAGATGPEQVLIVGRWLAEAASLPFPTGATAVANSAHRETHPLEQRLAFLESLIDQIPQGLFWKDRQAVYQWCNQSWATLVGLEAPRQIIGKTDRDLPWEAGEAESYEAHDQAVMTSGKAQFDRLSVRRWANGEQIWFTSSKLPWRDGQGVVQGILCTFEPITEHRRAAELKESKDLLQIVLDNIPQLLFWKDRQCRYLGCNRNWARAAGIDEPEAVVGLSDEEVWPPAEAQLYREQDEAVMASGVPVLHLIEQQQQADKVAWIDVNKIPIRDAEGNVIGILGTIEDITERKQAELALLESEAKLRQQATALETTLRELKQTQVQLIQTEKMSSLGQLVAGVAHEINNPVNFIHGNLSHAREYTQDLIGLVDLYQKYLDPPPAEIAEALEAADFDFLREDIDKLLNSMSIGTERIRKIVLSLRNFSRLDEAAVKDVDIHDGLESTLTILHGRLKGTSSQPGIQVVRQYDSIPKITCHVSQLNQVFMNILANAIDALNERDQPRSPTDCEADPSTITLTTCYLSDRRRIQIRIQDNGPGIPEAVRDRIFDPFYTTKAVGKGTGLGLSISYQIVVGNHGGDLRCETIPGKGTTFCIELPLTPPLQAPPACNIAWECSAVAIPF